MKEYENVQYLITLHRYRLITCLSRKLHGDNTFSWNEFPRCNQSNQSSQSSRYR